ncbi:MULTISPECIES: hypothetical protein [Acinetobacter]|uniref:Uncharacterized protein n=1 Tax=Acinetobacter piscicola TaxID=2006115 RepID=A0A7S6VX16_9GAMM|nr:MULTISPECIES: hypothetical protein [Acinetobacter]QOW46423.1 hypothetical protein G0028_11230 [Acinetobacter piscicola]
MNKISDVLERSLVQNFVVSLSAQTEQLDEIIDAMLNAPQHDLNQAIVQFIASQESHDLARALDIQKENLNAIQNGLALQKEHLADAAKIVALCLALETNSLKKLNIAESLNDFPM